VIRSLGINERVKVMSTRRSGLAALAVCVAAGMLATRAQGHHSIASFDHQSPITLSGTVKDFKYTNPHTWIYLMVPDGQGGESEWELEGGAVNFIVREGWTSKTVVPGMKVKLLIAPRLDGGHGGWWMRLLEINGQPFSPAAQ
jgi:hypothetical protein